MSAAGHDHSHKHSHGHGGCHHHDTSNMSERALMKAIGANMVLTVAQIGGGIASGSLSLVADALHNLSDAASLFIALIAVRIGRRPADENKTFGYKRAETIAALINLTTLIAVGVYLIGEAVRRFFVPEPIAGWTVVIIAGVALIVDLYTALLTWRQSKDSLNMRAAFLHNVSDALASVGVIVAGILIITKGWVIMDTIMTLIIAGYVLYHGIKAMPEVIHLLMEGTPDNVDVETTVKAMESVEGVDNVHHVHVWQIDEQKIALEAHVQILNVKDMMPIKAQLKKMLEADFGIHHSTLEFEMPEEDCETC